MIELAENTVRDRFKCAMRRLTSTVTIVTAEYGGRRHGMVATAVCSLGIDPPSLIASVAHTASLHSPLLTSGRFCVNLLTLSQADLVPVFSGQRSGEARFQCAFLLVAILPVNCRASARPGGWAGSYPGGCQVLRALAKFVAFATFSEIWAR